MKKLPLKFENRHMPLYGMHRVHVQQKCIYYYSLAGVYKYT